MKTRIVKTGLLVVLLGTLSSVLIHAQVSDDNKSLDNLLNRGVMTTVQPTFYNGGIISYNDTVSRHDLIELLAENDSDLERLRQMNTVRLLYNLNYEQPLQIDAFFGFLDKELDLFTLDKLIKERTKNSQLSSYASEMLPSISTSSETVKRKLSNGTKLPKEYVDAVQELVEVSAELETFLKSEQNSSEITKETIEKRREEGGFINDRFATIKQKYETTLKNIDQLSKNGAASTVFNEIISPLSSEISAHLKVVDSIITKTDTQQLFNLWEDILGILQEDEKFDSFTDELAVFLDSIGKHAELAYTDNVNSLLCWRSSIDSVEQFIKVLSRNFEQKVSRLDEIQDNTEKNIAIAQERNESTVELLRDLNTIKENIAGYSSGIGALDKLRKEFQNPHLRELYIMGIMEKLSELAKTEDRNLFSPGEWKTIELIKLLDGTDVPPGKENEAKKFKEMQRVAKLEIYPELKRSIEWQVSQNVANASKLQQVLQNATAEFENLKNDKELIAQKAIEQNIDFNRNFWARDIRFTKDAWFLEFSFKLPRLIHVDQPVLIENSDGSKEVFIKKRLVLYMIYNVKNTGKKIFGGTINGKLDGQINGQLESNLDGMVEGNIDGNFIGKATGMLDGNEINQDYNEKITGNFSGSLKGLFNGRFEGKLNGKFNGQVNAQLECRIDGNVNSRFSGKLDGQLNEQNASGDVNGLIIGRLAANLDGKVISEESANMIRSHLAENMAIDENLKTQVTEAMKKHEIELENYSKEFFTFEDLYENPKLPETRDLTLLTDTLIAPNLLEEGKYTFEMIEGKIRFLPRFYLVSDKLIDQENTGTEFDPRTGNLIVYEKRKTVAYPNKIFPLAIEAIKAQEGFTNQKLYSTIEISASELDVKEDRWGVVTWVYEDEANDYSGIDRTLDFFSIYVSGLTNSYYWEDVPFGEPGAYDMQEEGEKKLGTGRKMYRKTLELKFWRKGDEFDMKSKEYKLGQPGELDYRWIYL